MRTKLQIKNGQELKCAGTYIRRRKIRKPDRNVSLILLMNVWTQDGEYLTDHVWAECPEKYVFNRGDIFTFSAKVDSYIRFSHMLSSGWDFDYCLIEVKDIDVIRQTPPEIAQEIAALEKISHLSKSQKQQLRTLRTKQQKINIENKVKKQELNQKTAIPKKQKAKRKLPQPPKIVLMNPESPTAQIALKKGYGVLPQNYRVSTTLQ